MDNNYCFILTMWYVNKVVYTIAIDRAYRFILTMWYVNLVYLCINKHTKLSFILTMWYVNLLEGDEIVMKDGEFYINYVVCKLF